MMYPLEDVGNLFKKLSSWKEGSQREFSNIINYHSSSINKGINDLVQEVCSLKSKLSVITTERNELLERVDKLSVEIKELSTKLEMVQDFPDPEINSHQERPEPDLRISQIIVQSGNLEEVLDVGQQKNCPS